MFIPRTYIFKLLFKKRKKFKFSDAKLARLYCMAKQTGVVKKVTKKIEENLKRYLKQIIIRVLVNVSS